MLDGVSDGVLPEPLELAEGAFEFLDLVTGSLDGSGQKQNHLHDLLVLCNHLIEARFLVGISVFLLPVVQVLGTS